MRSFGSAFSIHTLLAAYLTFSVIASGKRYSLAFRFPYLYRYRGKKGVRFYVLSLRYKHIVAKTQDQCFHVAGMRRTI
jgi:hypothetical protein